MRIGIDAHILGKGKGGVETALRAIIPALAEVDRENEYFLYVSAGHPFRDGELPGNFRLRPLPVANPWIERPLVIPYLYRKDGLDVIHLQRMMAPWGCKRCVLHIHDLLYETRGEFFPRAKRLVFNRISRTSARRAAHIVTVTESSRQDIVRIYGIPAERVTVISNGVDHQVFHPRAQGVTDTLPARACGIPEPYVLVLGMIERHKGTDIAIRAFNRFAEAHPEYSLALIGKTRSEARGGYMEELRALIATSPARDRIFMPGYVPADTIPGWMHGASMLVFPGTAEGFGLPPLEAMAAGLPVVAAQSPVAQEVYAEAALLTAPDSDSIATAMCRMVVDDDLRRCLIARGLDRSSQFTWRKVAERLLPVYKEASDYRSEAARY